MDVTDDPIHDVNMRLAEVAQKLTDKQLTFVTAVSGGATHMEAGKLAQYSPHSVNSGHIMKSRAVQDYTKLLIEKDVLLTGYSTAWKRRELVATYRHAREIDQPSAAIRAVETLAKMDGDLLPDTQVNVNFGQLPEIRDISPEDLETASKMYREIRGLNQPETVVNG